MALGAQVTVVMKPILGFGIEQALIGHVSRADHTRGGDRNERQRNALES
jgi:hypothetical protein